MIKYLILLCFLFLVVLYFRNFKYFIYAYIATRSFFAIFYDVNILGGYTILHIEGILFPMLVLAYWLNRNKRMNFNVLQIKYLWLISWVVIVSIISLAEQGFQGENSFSSIIKILNGFSVFICFPIIFVDEKSIINLLKSFWISTLFPLAQALTQLFLGINVGGMKSSLMDSNRGYVMLYGFYYKYDGYAWASLTGALIMLFFIRYSERKWKLVNILFYFQFFLFILMGLLTLSRTLLVNLLIISIFLFIISNVKYKLILLTMGFILFTSSTLFKRQVEQIEKRSETEMKVLSGEMRRDFALHGRVGLWEEKIEQFLVLDIEKKLFGSQLEIGPHGDYIRWLLSYGIIGICIYLYFHLSLLNFLLKKTLEVQNSFGKSLGSMVTVGMIVFLVGSISYNSTQYPDHMYFFHGLSSIFLSFKIIKKLKSNI